MDCAGRSMFANRRGRGICFRVNAPTPFHGCTHVVNQLLQRGRNFLAIFIFGLWTLDLGLIEQPRVPPPDHFRHACKVILSHDRFDFETSIICAVGTAVFEPNH